VLWCLYATLRLIACRMKSRIAHRIKQLESLADNLTDHLKVKAMIELRALKLLGYQTQVEYSVLIYAITAAKQ